LRPHEEAQTLTIFFLTHERQQSGGGVAGTEKKWVGQTKKEKTGEGPGGTCRRKTKPDLKENLQRLVTQPMDGQG